MKKTRLISLVMLVVLFSSLLAPVATAAQPSLTAASHSRLKSGAETEEDPSSLPADSGAVSTQEENSHPPVSTPREKSDASKAAGGAKNNALRNATGPCNAPAYCTEAGCTCATEGAAACVCSAACPCRTLTINPCPTPQQCTNADCLCKSTGDPNLCVCDDLCACHMPFFNTKTTTELETSPLKTGSIANLKVDTSLSSTEGTFSDIIYKTYIKSPLMPMDDIDLGGLLTLGNIYTEGDYTVIEVKSPSTGSVSSSYNLEVRFPPGVTADGTEAEVYTVITGKIHSKDETWDFNEVENDTIEKFTAVAAADSDWDIAAKNVELDYKDPGDTSENIFRTRINLDRHPKGNLGVLYLEEDSASVTVTLPGDTADDLKILRVTDREGNPVTYERLPGTNQIKVTGANIPFNAAFTDGVSSADSALFYVVYELADDFLSTQKKEEVAPGFWTYPDLSIDSRLNYQQVTQEPREKKPTPRWILSTISRAKARAAGGIS